MDWVFINSDVGLVLVQDRTELKALEAFDWSINVPTLSNGHEVTDRNNVIMDNGK